MNPTLTICLIVVSLATIGALVLYLDLFKHSRELESALDAHDEADRNRQQELIGMIQRFAKATGNRIANDDRETLHARSDVRLQQLATRQVLSDELAQTRKELAEALKIHDAKVVYEAATYADQTQRLVKEEGKKTRKEAQELKAGNEWSKKREHEIDDKLDTILKRLPETQIDVPMTVELPYEAGTSTLVLKEGETITVNGTKVTAAGKTSVNGDIQDKRKTKARKPKSKK